MNLNDTNLYVNRELSWLEFNERVLEEAYDKSNPLMERLKFLAITASNLDEFFMIRVSSIMRSTNMAADTSGLTPGELLSAISKRVHEMVDRQYSCFTRSLRPAMEKEGIHFLAYGDLSEAQKVFVDNYFHDVLYQVITPMAIDQSRPFPTINNLRPYIFISLTTPGDEALPVHSVAWDSEENRWRISDERIHGAKYAVVQVPTVVGRIVALPSEEGRFDYILLENIILAHINSLFQGHCVSRTAMMRVTRNSDLIIDEEEADDLMHELTRSIKDRRRGEPVRIEITKGIDMTAMGLLENALKLTDDKIYDIAGPLDLKTWMEFSLRPEFEHLRHTPINPTPVPDFAQQESMFGVIRKKDVLVHHPYMSFDCVVRFLEQAAEDPKVLAIKHTLYRVSGNSPIINALILAAENGKQVSVLMELKARFDEENNIHYAKLLEKSGVHVIYGLTGLKTHCKVCLVVRSEGDSIRRYMHFGTGNYNEATAKIYTDFGYFTSQEALGQDSTALFNVLTGYSKISEWQKLAVAPLTLRSNFLNLIETEEKNAKEGRPAAITARMNSLTDIKMIQALYKASAAGVKIRLLVRGMCCLKPGIPGISHNITVSSIIDRYLEHSRAYVFENNGQPKVYLASADWMSRNLDRRVEVMFPIETPSLKQEVIDLLELSLSDNVKRRELGEDGLYQKPSRRGRTKIHSQIESHRLAAESYAAVKG
ncbi:MAG: polyphosphate kinase 1 [Defluviitaleaceae bacterium]|nr:polyphosphate kinase 1 [Defluviitaleaceae bacterium]